MTLNTSIAIHEPMPVREVYEYAAALLGTPTPIVERAQPQSSTWMPGLLSLRNPPGIGLPALLWVNYGADGPMLTTPDPSEDPEDRAYRENDPTQNGWAAIEVTFDTGYAYDRNGATCSDLHAWLVRELGRWLDARGKTWRWQDEFTGEWHDRYEGLDEFGDTARGALS